MNKLLNVLMQMKKSQKNQYQLRWVLVILKPIKIT